MLFSFLWRAACCVLVVVSLVACSRSTAPNTTSPNTQNQPNVLLIVGQGIGYGDLSSFGSVSTHTPKLDALAAEGLRFSQATTTGAGQTAALYALLYGRIASHAQLPVTLGAGQAGVAANEYSLAKALGDRGYRSAFIGAWPLGSKPESLPRQQGFDYFFGLPWDDGSSPLAPLTENERALDDAANPVTALDRLTASAERFLNSKKDQPFFLVFSVPQIAAEGDALLGDHGNRVEAFDDAVGQILSRLKDQGLDRNTLVVFISATSAERTTRDRSTGSNAVFRDGAGSTWEGGVRVPAIVRGPGVTVGEDSLATLWLPDIFVTLANFTGAQLPNDRVYDGASRPLVLSGTQTAASGDEAVIYLHDSATHTLSAVRRGAWKLHLSTTDTDAEPSDTLPSLPLSPLYNVNVDPSERHDVSLTHADIVLELLQLANAHRATFKE